MAKKILFIEDEQCQAEMYKMKFEREGYEVLIADDGEAGLNIAQSEKPDLILLDLVMPKMDGFQVLEKLKSNDLTKNIKVYILSNLGQDDEIKRGFASGADGYFLKANLTPGQLADQVKRIFSGKQAGMKRISVE